MSTTRESEAFTPHVRETPLIPTSVRTDDELSYFITGSGADQRKTQPYYLLRLALLDEVNDGVEKDGQSKQGSSSSRDREK